MRVLGISAFYHDAAAALVVDGRLVAAAQESASPAGSTTRDSLRTRRRTACAKAVWGSPSWT